MTGERVARGTAAMLELRRRRLEAGARPLGWKVGFGAPSALELLGTSAPLVGFLTDATLLAPGATVALDGWTVPVLEPELAVTVGEGATIAGLAAAIELADVHPPPADPEAILAGNIFHRAVVLGDPDPGRSSADGIAVRVLRGGEEIAATAEPEALTGALGELVGLVAEAAGGELRPGDVVICGSVVPAVPLRPGDELRVEVDPLGALELRFQ